MLIRVSILAGLLMAAGMPAQAQTTASPPRALLFTEINHPLSFLPGRTDGLAANSFSIGRSAFSPSGGRWVVSLVGRRSTAPTSPTVVVSGSPRGISSVHVQAEPLPGVDYAFQNSPTSLGINDRGDFAIGTQAVPGTASDRVLIARYSAATRLFDTAARQGALIAGLELSVPGAAGETYGANLSVANVLPAGEVALVAKSTSGPLATERDEFLLINSAPVQVLAQTGVLAPLGQPGAAGALLANMERIASVAPLADHWLLLGQLGSTGFPDVVVVNGQVVLQEGLPVAGLTGDITAPTAKVFPGGHWVARGTSSAGVRYLIANGSLRLVQGAPVPGLEALGVVTSVGNAAMNLRGDLAYEVAIGSGRHWVMVQRASGGTPLIVAGPGTEIDVGGSPRGPVFYSTPLSLDMGIALSDTLVYFSGRLTDTAGLNVADGLYVARIPSVTKGFTGAGQTGW
jgi:hypothetical protein